MAGTRKRLLAGMGALAVTLGGASFAWACSSQAAVVFGSASGTASGPAGASVDVRGSQWNAAPVHIKWNSLAGEELPSTPAATGPSFSVAIEIPKTASPGVHTVYFVQYERTAPGDATQEAVTGTARLAFEVTPPGSGDVRYSAPQDNSPATRTSSSTNGGDESAAAPGGGAYSTSSATSGGDAPAGTSAPSDKSFGSLAPATPAPAADTPSPAANGSAAAAVQTASAPRSVIPGQPTAVATEQAQTVFGGSVASTGPAVAPGAPPDEAQASPRSATGDVWAGFEPGNASLVPGLGDSPTGLSGSGSSLALGVGLLSAGIGMLFAGFGVAEVRRQRAFARQG